MVEYAENIYRILYNASEIFVRLGIKDVVLCPGSRSAPVAITLMNNPALKCLVNNDERSAAYIATGIAGQTRTPVVLVCTSGTAALNFAPAVAEAYFQGIPLIVITADRPVEWIGQNENQTINQYRLYEPNVLKSYQLNIAYTDPDTEWESYRIISEAVNYSMRLFPGPVHINIPLKEPLYPSRQVQFVKEDIKIIHLSKTEHVLKREEQKEIIKELADYNKIMILAGLLTPNPRLRQYFSRLTEIIDIVFIPDIVSNLHGFPRSISHTEGIIKGLSEDQKQELKPDLLITLGGQVVSNIFKSYLRCYKPSAHWHIDFKGNSFDSYRSLTRIIPLEPDYFLRMLLRNIVFFRKKSYSGYFRKWEKLDLESGINIQKKLNDPDKKELYLSDRIIKHLPKNSILHLGNSLPVRYFNNLGLKENPQSKTISVYSNRGTSGIDGTLSTALGCALSSNKTVTVVTGDLSFFYDRNALWNKYLSANLKIIVMNNHGGQIFSKMPGPKSRPELEEYFVAGQNLNLKETAIQHDLNYLYCKDVQQIDLFLDKLYENDKKTILLELEI